MELIAYIGRKDLEPMTWLIEGLSLKIVETSSRKKCDDCKINISGSVTDLNQLTEKYSLFKKDRLFLEPKLENAS